MKRKVLLALAIMALFVCIFAISVSAAGSTSNAYGEITSIEGETEPTSFDKTSRVVIEASDGTYYTFPSYYVLADSVNFTWRKNDSVNALLGYDGQSASNMRLKVVRMEIPEGITGLNPNNGGGANAFESGQKLIEVKLPTTMAKIGDHVFNKCYNLETIDGFLEYFAKATYVGNQMLAETKWGDGVDLVIPSTITSLSARCFFGTKIKSVTFHEQIVTLGERAFQSCKNLTSVTIPSSLVYMKNHVFASCTNLSYVDMSKCTRLTEIGEFCFEYTKLTSFDFSPFASNMTAIGRGVFNGCSSLTTVVAYEDVACATTVGDLMFYACPLTEIKFPPNVTSIGANAFKGHRSVQSELKIPNGVTTIGDHAFARGATGGTEGGLTIYLPASLETITGDYTFEFWHYTKMYIPAGLASAVKGMTNGTLQKGVVYYYTGEINGLVINTTNNHNAALSNAEWISVDEFTGASADKNYIVYGYNYCDAFYEGAHAMSGNATMQKLDYFKGVFFADTCERKECGINAIDESKTIGAIFVNYGYSMTETEINGKLSMSQFFGIDKANLDKYTALTNATFEYGFVVSSNADPMNEANNGLIAEGKTHITDQSKFAHDYFAVTVVGFTDATVDKGLTFCVYVKDGDSISYLDNGETVETVNMKSYNEIKTLLENKNNNTEVTE